MPASESTGRVERDLPAGPGPLDASDEGLIRALGVGSATLFVIGSVIGSGIFLTTGLMVATVPSAGLVLTAWIAGGALALAGALTYAELGTMFPRSGGLYVFLSHAYGAPLAFLYGWTALLVVLAGGIAAVSVGFADYVSYFLPSLSLTRPVVTAGPLTLTAGQVTAVASIILLGAINYVGVRQGNAVNVVLTTLKVCGLAAIPLFALWAAPVRPDLSLAVPPGVARPGAAFGVLMIAVFWAYEGWYFLTFAAGEVRRPHQTVPRALALGTLALTAIYVAVNLSYFSALPLEDLRGVSRIGERAATALVGPWGATFISATVVVSTLGANTAALLAGSRLLFAMAEDGVFFRHAAAVHPRFRTPNVAIVALTVWASVLALSGTYQQLFTYVAFGSLLFAAGGGLAVFRLRRTMPDHPRPYRTWGYPIVPAVFVLGCLAFVVNTMMERPAESLAGLGLIALGLPAYVYWRTPATRDAAR